MKRYTRDEVLRESGAGSEELDDLRAQKLLVPNHHRRLFGRGEEYYTEDQLEVLRWFVKTSRATRASQRRV